MANPEVGIYTGSLNEDLDLVYFNRQNTFGIFYTSKEITSTSPPWPHKMPLESAIPCTHPRTWNKHCKETQKIIEIAGDHGDWIGFESHIRKAITEILDSIREVHNELLKLEEDEELDFIIHICNYCPTDGHLHCDWKDKDCKLRSD